MKTCPSCNTEKPESEFYPAHEVKDGLSAKCKTCLISYAKQYKTNHRTQVRLYQKQHTARLRSSPEGKRSIQKARSKYYQLHPDRCNARGKLRYAVRTGKIIRPAKCDKCSTPCIPHGHHPDYSKPLSVLWLCESCHLIHHGMKTP